MPLGVSHSRRPSQIHLALNLPLICPGFPYPWPHPASLPQRSSFPTPSKNPEDSRRQEVNKSGSFYCHCSEPAVGEAPLPVSLGLPR